MAKLQQQQHQGVVQINKHGSKYNAAAITKVKRTRRRVPRDSPPQRSSIYRGVTRHRWTGRFEAHLWDKNCWNESQNKKGRQVYLGAYDDEEAAAHAYDLAALKYWGEDTILNFPLSTYEKELKDMEGQSREEYIGSLRRKSSGFSRGVSKYRGVARHHHNGRWEARIGRVFGHKYLYLGTYATQEEAATAYDMAAIEYRGLNAVTNFDLSRYIKWLRPNNNNSQNGVSDPPENPNSSVKLIVDPHNNNSLPPPPPTNPGHDLGFVSKFLQNQPHSSASIATVDFNDVHTATASQPRHTNATSALGLLLQSSKFKEMMEMTTTTATDTTSYYDPPKCSFPENIQTYFECHRDLEEANYGDNGDDFLFGDLNSFAPPIFNCGTIQEELKHFSA